MALLQSTLASLLTTALDPELPTSGDITSSDFSTRIAQAFGAYFKDATPAVLSDPIDDDAVPAMADAMSFPAGATPAEGAAALTAGYTAFWAEMVSAPVAFFGPTATVVVAALGLTALPAAFAADFVTNLDPTTTTAQAAATLAASIHPNAGLTGTVTFASPPPVAIV